MKDFFSWTLDVIRESGLSMGWMEERRSDWVPLAASSIDRLINAQTFLIITDKDREWFAKYILSHLNKADFDRPILPIITLDAIFPHVESVKDQDQLAILDDMLTLLFPQGYSYFYIGKGNDSRAKIAKNRGDSLMWIFDEKLQNSFYMSSKDPQLDTKLIQLISLFDKSIDAVMFSEVDMQGSL